MSGGNVAPLLDHRLLNLSGVLSASGTDLFGNVNALFGGFEQGHQFGHMSAGTLGLQVTGFFRNLEI